MPRWSEDHCTMLGMGVGKMDNILPTIRCLVREHRVPPERAIRLLTQNVADGLCLSRKGRLTVGADADVLLVDRDWNIHTVLAGGEIMVSDGRWLNNPIFLRKQVDGMAGVWLCRSLFGRDTLQTALVPAKIKARPQFQERMET